MTGAKLADRQLISLNLPISSRCSAIESSDCRKKSVETWVRQFKVWLGTMSQEIHFCSVTTSKTSVTTLEHLIPGVKFQDTKILQQGTKMRPMIRSARFYREMIRIGSQKLQLTQGGMRYPSTTRLLSWDTPLSMKCHRESTWLKTLSSQMILLYQLKSLRNLGDIRESKFRWVWTPLRSRYMTKIPWPRRMFRSWPSPGRRPHRTN